MCDREADRIQLFSPDGEFLSEWRDTQRPTHLCFDAQGRAYATGIIAIYLFLTWTLSSILVNIAQQGPVGPNGVPFGPRAVAPLGARLGGLIA